MTPDIDELERLAEAARPKNSPSGLDFRGPLAIEIRGRVNLTQDEVNYINTVDPATILSLVRELRLLRDLENRTREIEATAFNIADGLTLEIFMKLDALRSEQQS